MCQHVWTGRPAHQCDVITNNKRTKNIQKLMQTLAYHILSLYAHKVGAGALSLSINWSSSQNHILPTSLPEVLTFWSLVVFLSGLFLPFVVASSARHSAHHNQHRC